MAVVNPGAKIWVAATRVSVLDASGFPVAGSNTFTTNTLMKASVSPAMESGDDIFVKNAAGDGSAFGRHGDMRKYYTVQLELTIKDPQLEAACAGGTVFSSAAAALGAPTGMTAVGQTTLGTLAAATYGYRVAQYNSFGETPAAPEVTVTTSGGTGLVVLTGTALAATALGARFYGRTPGGEQYLGSYINIGTQATNASSGTSPTSLTLTALTKPIPAGYTFTIAGDSNSPKIIFKTSAAAGVGAITVPVTYNQGAGGAITTIASGNIVPVFVDDSTITPSGAFIATGGTDLTAGPGTGIGYQEPALGAVANPNGVSLEFWSKRYINGAWQTDYPYLHTVVPKVTGMHQMPKDYTNNNLGLVLEGQAFPNANWGTGPAGDFPVDSTQVVQDCICGSQILPAAGLAAVVANL